MKSVAKKIFLGSLFMFSLHSADGGKPQASFFSFGLLTYDGDSTKAALDRDQKSIAAGLSTKHVKYGRANIPGGKQGIFAKLEVEYRFDRFGVPFRASTICPLDFDGFSSDYSVEVGQTVDQDGQAYECVARAELVLGKGSFPLFLPKDPGAFVEVKERDLYARWGEGERLEPFRKSEIGMSTPGLTVLKLK